MRILKQLGRPQLPRWEQVIPSIAAIVGYSAHIKKRSQRAERPVTSSIQGKKSHQYIQLIPAFR